MTRCSRNVAAKFVEHFLWIAAAMNRPGGDGMWDEEDGFYYDILRRPTERARGSRCDRWWDYCRFAPRRLSSRGNETGFRSCGIIC